MHAGLTRSPAFGVVAKPKSPRSTSTAISRSNPASASSPQGTTPDPFEASLVDLLLPPENPFRGTITILPSAPSTQDLLRPSPSQGPRTLPAVLAAQIQTAGRGRQGKIWASDQPHGLWVSLLLEVSPDRLPILSLLAALAASDAVRALTDLETTYKWPNDLLLQNRKLAGILVETIARPHATPLALLGLGLNLTQKLSDFPAHLKNTAISLRQVTGRNLPRAQILAAFLDSLVTRLAQPIPEALEEWRNACIHLGRTTRIDSGGEELIGIAESLDDSGHLHLRLPDGSLRIIASGEADFPA